jgi:hypothetical protein
VTITGQNFTQLGAGTSTVTVGGMAATNVVVVSDTTITATFPALAAGTYSVVLTNNLGAVTLANSFIYSPPPGAPTNLNLTATATSSSQITLSWTAATDSVGVTG